MHVWPEESAYNNLHRIVFDHLDQLFPAKNGVTLDGSDKAGDKNAFVNGAQGGTGEENEREARK